MNISKLSSRSKVSEVHSVAEQVSFSFSKKNFEADANLSAMLNSLNNEKDKMSGAINHSKDESGLDKKDADRDFVIRGVNLTIQAALYSVDGSIKEAGETLLKVFHKYGVAMILESYAIESSLIKAFLADIDTEKMKDAIKLIPHLEDLIERLTEAQLAFEEAENDWNKVKSSKTTSASTLRKELSNIINNQIVTYLTALFSINPAYKEIAIEVNEIIETANRTIHRKQSDTESLIVPDATESTK